MKIFWVVTLEHRYYWFMKKPDIKNLMLSVPLSIFYSLLTSTSLNMWLIWTLFLMLTSSPKVDCRYLGCAVFCKNSPGRVFAFSQKFSHFSVLNCFFFSHVLLCFLIAYVNKKKFCFKIFIVCFVKLERCLRR